MGLTAPRVKKIVRKHVPGKLTVEQTTDRDLFCRTLVAAGEANQLKEPANCLLIALLGDEPVGAAAVNTLVDTGRLQCIAVREALRHRGIGSELVRAARIAAHTRGARYLSAAGPPGLDHFFRQLDFVLESPPAEAPSGCCRWTLDLSRDGIIER